MPVTTRKRKAAEPQGRQPDLINPSTTGISKRSSAVSYKDDDPFEAAFDTFNRSSSDGESDVSDFAKRESSRTKRRRSNNKQAVRKKKLQKIGPGPAPEAPNLSDNELSDGEEEEKTNMPVSGRTAVTSTSTSTLSITTPSIIQLEVGERATINLNLANLIRHNSLKFHIALSTGKHGVEGISARGGCAEKDNLFLGLPPELRNRIYRMVLVTDSPIIFHKRNNFERSSQFLRTCHRIAEEGTGAMYGENSFHFERTAERRGRFWEETWKEVGFKDVRRFLETIGSGNVSKMRYLSFSLEDATPYLSQGLDQAERKFVNDPVLHRILNLIAANTVLSRVDVVFGGRAQVQLTDYHFLKALSTMRARTVKFPKNLRGYPQRVTDAVLDKLVPIMTIPDADAANVDKSKSKITRKIKMHLDQPTKTNYSTFAW